MTDKEFELISERVLLLTNDGYFARHRELSAEHGVKLAWQMVEEELPLGIRRYNSYFSFQNAKKKYIEGSMPARVQLTVKG